MIFYYVKTYYKVSATETKKSYKKQIINEIAIRHFLILYSKRFSVQDFKLGKFSFYGFYF